MDAEVAKSRDKIYTLETELTAHARECAEREKQRQKFEKRAEEHFEKLDQKITANAQSSENALREIELARAGEEAIRKAITRISVMMFGTVLISGRVHSEGYYCMSSDRERRKRRRAELARRNKFQKFLDNELRELAYDTKRRMRFWAWTWFCVIIGGIIGWLL